ncbi:centrosomal protein of 162 kDa isoform X3 [Osmerus eperlanus]|uniref:centrosomal protein of 162 kDa isoform X3 n=1 Tax=Osmerus eperlanus TaxID=29151 RepID=UPI002E151577
MSRLTKEELDEQFEQFLKESVSDESVDLGGTGSTHRSSVLDSLGKARPAPKPQKKSAVSVPWWQDEDDSEGGPGRESSVKRRFTKVRKAQAEDTQQDAILPGKGPPEGTSPAPSLLPPEAVRAEPRFKPTPKPRSKPLDRLSQLDKIHTANQEVPWPEVDSHSEIQRSPTNESSHNAPGVRSPDESLPEGSARASSDSDSQSSGDGLLVSGRTFRKSLRRSQPIQEEEEGRPGEEELGPVVSFSRYSQEQEDPLLASGRSRGLAGGGLAGGGLDTLEEEEEKARFFARLEGGPSAVDYSRLNRELESTSSTTATTLRNAERVVGLEDREQDEEVESPAASPHYSEDFEDEGSAREDEEQKPLRPAMLARVSLHDSLDSTCEVLPTGERGGSEEEEQERRREARDTADSLETETALPARSYGQSGGSDMEALHEAYRQISLPAEGSGAPSPQLPAPQLPAPPGGRDRTSSPGSPPAPTTTSPPGPGAPSGSLRAASTSGSDLPTAEELLRRIMPDTDDSRGFTLQPVSGAELHPSSPGRSGERCSPQTSPRRWASSAPSPDAPSPAPRTPSIREEVSRLMQEGGLWPPDLLSLPGTHQQRQVPSWSAASGPPSAPQRRGRGGGRKPPTVAPRSPGPGRPGAGAGVRAKAGAGVRAGAKTGANAGVRPGAGAKPPSTLDQTRAISSSPALSVQTQAPQALRVSGELVASVQSFAAFLQHQIDTGGRQNTADVSRETRERPEGGRREPGWREESRAEERPLVDRVRLQPDQDREEGTARDQLTQQELSSLRQENFLLQSKLRSVEETSRRGRWCVDPSDPLSDKIQLMEKEMNNQEILIQGYHQENEKLYQQMKSLQAQRKVDEEAMFLENQRLLSELALTREQMNKSNMQRTVGNVGVVDQSQRITELLGQIQAAQRVEARLVEETARLKQEKQGLEVDLQVMRRERDQAHTLTSPGQAGWEQEERHREEVCALTRRLQWYADNQDLLDRDTARLKDATAEISKLTQQVEKLKAEVGRSRAVQRQSRAQERAADARRTQNLERQVKELEAILRRRNPNSLPALLYAAAGANGAHDQGGEPPTQTAALLERRVHRLEAELESKDEDAKRSLRTMEQQFQRIKLQYEQQISELERQVAAGTGPSESWETRVRLLQEELGRLQETQQAREQALQDQVHLLQGQLSQRAQAGPGPGTRPGPGTTPSLEPGTGPEPGPGTRPSLEPGPEPGSGRGLRSPSRHQRQTEAAQGARIERLTQELAAKTRSVQELTRTVDRLQRERRTMLGGPAPGPRPEARAGDPRRPAPPPAPPADPGERGEAAFPPTLDEKAYQPTAFAGSHISEVLQEKEALRERLERLEVERGQERLERLEDAALAREELCRLQESSAEQLSCVQVVHQGELERLLARHALEHSSSKLAQLTNHIATQEVVVQHLREQVKDLQSTKDALAVSKLREDALQDQLARLLEDLKQATEAHSPQLRHFLSLDRKIHSMEVRHAQRERELQQVVGRSLPGQQQGEAGEAQAWRRLAQERSRELEVFRLELDSILDILRALQQQGVVIPSPAHLGGAWTT